MENQQQVAIFAALAAMAKMCLCDGIVSDEEHDFLQSMIPAGSGLSVQALLDQVKGRSMSSLCADIPRYEDRFFIALRAYAMAHVDGHFDSREELVFSKLVVELGILPEDVVLIEQTEQSTEDVMVEEASPRLKSLYEDSSFVSN